MEWRRLSGVEILELFWRSILVGLLIWFGWLISDLARLRQVDAAAVAWAWAENHTRQLEQIRLLKAICTQTGTPYDVARGVCDPAGGAEVKRPEIPKLKGGPYKK